MKRSLFLHPELLSRLVFLRDPDGGHRVHAVAGDKARPAGPEELIRQLFALSLVHHYAYPEASLRFELPVQMGRERKRADIAVTDPTGRVYCIVEVKQQIDGDAFEQLRSYVAITGAEYGVLVSVDELRCFRHAGAATLVELDDLPVYGVDSARVLASSTPPSTGVPTRAGMDVASEVKDLQRIDRKSIACTVQGRKVVLRLSDFVSLTKFRRRLLDEGIHLRSAPKRDDWSVFVSAQLQAAPMPKIPEKRPVPVRDVWHDKVVSWCADKDEVRIPEVLAQAAGVSIERHSNLLLGRVRKILRSEGWGTQVAWRGGKALRVWRRHWRPDESAVVGEHQTEE